MTWVANDRQRLVQILQLDWGEDLGTSILASLMQDVQTRDPDRIAPIQDLMAKIEAIDAKELAQLEAIALSDTAIYDGKRKREKIDYVSEEEFFSPSDQNAIISAGSRLKSRYCQDIIRYLDRYGYLNRSRGVGRAIDGV